MHRSRFLATGTFYHVVGDAHGPSRATVHRTIHRVMAAIVRRLLGVVRFPSTVDACREEQEAFREMAGMPYVIGKFIFAAMIRDKRCGYLFRLKLSAKGTKWESNKRWITGSGHV